MRGSAAHGPNTLAPAVIAKGELYALPPDALNLNAFVHGARVTTRHENRLTRESIFQATWYRSPRWIPLILQNYA